MVLCFDFFLTVFKCGVDNRTQWLVSVLQKVEEFNLI